MLASARPRVRFLAVVVLAGLVAVVAAAWAPAAPRGRAAVASATLVPAADAYVAAGHAHHNLGRLPLLAVRRRPAMRAYLRFNARSSTARVRRATLYLYSLRAARHGVRVRRAADLRWNEHAITWHHMPSVGHASVRSGPLPANGWRAVDVTSLLDGDKDVELALTGMGSDDVILRSKEAGYTAPRLVLDYGAGAVPTGPRPALPGTPVGSGSPSSPSSPTPSPSPGVHPPAGSPCGAAGSPPATYQHVIWIVFENESTGNIIGNSNYPYTNQIAKQCASPTNFWAETHPSLPNYIAMTSGSTQGITGDSSGMLAADNIYNQVKQSGRQWRHYAFGMPSPCDHSDSSNAVYTAHHEPPVFYSDIAADCQNWDVGVGDPSKVEDFTDVSSGPLAQALDSNTLPAFATLGPTDDGGNSSAGGEVDPVKGEAFLKRWIPRITSSAAYQAGTTAIFITWDEAGDFNNNPPKEGIPTIVIAPTVPTGARPGTRFDHYSMLRTTEEMLGIRHYLGAAAGAPSMRAALHL